MFADSRLYVRTSWKLEWSYFGGLLDIVMEYRTYPGRVAVVDRPIGSGTFGHVFKASSKLFHGDVAVKVLKDDRYAATSSLSILTEPGQRVGYKRESCELMALRRHPNIVRAFGVL